MCCAFSGDPPDVGLKDARAGIAGRDARWNARAGAGAARSPPEEARRRRPVAPRVRPLGRQVRPRRRRLRRRGLRRERRRAARHDAHVVVAEGRRRRPAGGPGRPRAPEEVAHAVNGGRRSLARPAWQPQSRAAARVSGEEVGHSVKLAARQKHNWRLAARGRRCRRDRSSTADRNPRGSSRASALLSFLAPL